MKKLWFMGIFILIFSFVLIGCSDDADANNNADNENNEENVDDNDDENTDNEENDNDENNNENNAMSNEMNNNDEDNNSYNNDEETSIFGNDDTDEEDAEAMEEEPLDDAIDVVDVETVLLDGDEAEKIRPNDKVFIELDDLMYVDHHFITELLDYELTYDEDNTFAEVFDEKGDFKYEPSHDDEGGAIMDIGQIYDEDADDYIDVPDDAEDLYKFIEYEGKLYVPQQLVNVFLKEPMHYDRRDKAMEVGAQTEATDLYDVGINDTGGSHAEVTKDASAVTIEGENHEGGIIITDVNSAEKDAPIDIDYQYSKINGFVYNKSKEDTIEVSFSYDGENIIETLEVEPQEMEEFDHDVNGEEVFHIAAKGEPGAESKAIVIGELK